MDSRSLWLEKTALLVFNFVRCMRINHANRLEDQCLMLRVLLAIFGGWLKSRSLRFERYVHWLISYILLNDTSCLNRIILAWPRQVHHFLLLLYNFSNSLCICGWQSSWLHRFNLCSPVGVINVIGSDWWISLRSLIIKWELGVSCKKPCVSLWVRTKVDVADLLIFLEFLSYICCEL